MTKPWWENGIRFECQGSGKCCTSHGEFGFVFLTPQDRQRIAKHLGIATQTFTKKYCQKRNGAYHLKEDGINLDCLFLKDKRCGIYEARPTQCRTWPFWPEVMNAKSWNQEVKNFCPGVGKGPLISKEEIESKLKEQTASENEILKEAAALSS
jgi:Fe-S-cluster containining protein